MAIEQMAVRVRFEPFHEWYSNDILKPQDSLRFRTVTSHKMNSFNFAAAPRMERLNEFEMFHEYLAMKRSFKPFIHMVGYPKSDPKRYTAEWHHRLWNACSAAGLKAVSGDAYYNRFDDDKMRRVTDLINPLKVTCPKSGAYAELWDLEEAGPTKIKALKILMIRNPNRVNPSGVRRFVRELMHTIICTLDYDI